MKKYLLLLIVVFTTANYSLLLAKENPNILDSLLDIYSKFNNQNDLIKGERLNKEILKLAIEQNNKEAQIRTLNNLSFFSVFKNDYLKSFNYSEQAINLAKEIKNDRILADLYINKSRLFLKINNIDGAIKYLIKGRKIAFKINTNAQYQFYYNSLAHFYYNQNEFNKAIANFKLALLKAVNLNDSNSYRSSFDNIGLCYRNMGNYKMAEYYFMKAIYFARRYKYPTGLVNATINLSKNFYLNNQLGKAIEMAEYTVSVIKTNDIPLNFHIEISINLARIYLLKKDFIKTDSILHVINNLLEKKNVFDNDKIDYLELTYKKNKVSKSPFYIASFEKYLQAKDSLQNLKRVVLENSLKDKFAIAEKLEDYDNIEHNFELKKMENKWIMVFGFIFLAGLVILLYIIYKAKSNIKELKILQEEIKKQNKNLELFNKQKDYILATVAHDLRGPVGNINTITSVISLDETLNEENKTLINLINQSADLSMSIINDLVDAINVDRKNELLKEDKIVLNEVIDTVIKLQNENLNKKKINVQLDCFPGLEIKGDRSFIIRVLFNLISNAIKFSNINTEIQIETSLYDEDNVLIKIKDHGIGIDTDKLEAIFEPFTSASRRGVAGEKSIGLGLSICKKIVELHHGKIWVESKPNHGSTFFIILPVNYLNKILKSIPFKF
ncbi:MAG: ATP-binding protein [Bacteroidia bacterium]